MPEHQGPSAYTGVNGIQREPETEKDTPSSTHRPISITCCMVELNYAMFCFQSEKMKINHSPNWNQTHNRRVHSQNPVCVTTVSDKQMVITNKYKFGNKMCTDNNMYEDEI